jgi:hypothetical protein
MTPYNRNYHSYKRHSGRKGCPSSITCHWRIQRYIASPALPCTRWPCWVVRQFSGSFLKTSIDHSDCIINRIVWPKPEPLADLEMVWSYLHDRVHHSKVCCRRLKFLVEYLPLGMKFGRSTKSFFGHDCENLNRPVCFPIPSPSLSSTPLPIQSMKLLWPKSSLANSPVFICHSAAKSYPK